jgi:hypothetical protein
VSRQLFVFTAGRPAARAHLDHSVRNQIDLQKALTSTSTLTREQIRNIQQQYGLYGWGAVPGPQNIPRWQYMQRGDWILGVWEDAYQVIAQVVQTVQDRQLATAIWHLDDDGSAFEYMYFFTKPTFINVLVRDAAPPLPSRFQGFFRPSDESLESIAASFGSVDRFIKQKFGVDPDRSLDEEVVPTPQGAAAGTASRTWIFQGNPGYFDTRGQVRAGGNTCWLVNRYAEEMSPGDPVYLWESGDSAGIVGKARILEVSKMREPLESEKPFILVPEKFDNQKLRALLAVERAFDPAISRVLLGSLPETKDLDVIRIKQGTNFSVTQDQATALAALENTYLTKQHTVQVAGLPVRASAHEVIGAFRGTLAEHWEDKPGISPRWLVSLHEECKPLKAVLRNVQGVPKNASFTTNEARRFLGSHGFACLDTEAMKRPEADATDLCLIGTWKEVLDDIDYVEQAIAERGAWASWWSFTIADDIGAALEKPFYLYVYAGSHTFPVRVRVEAYKTSRGTDGIASPWPEITDEELVGKTKAGDKQSEVFKTWFRVTRIERLEPPLGRDDFTPVAPSTPESLTNQNAFGYARVRKRAPLVSVNGAPYGIEEAIEDLFISRDEFLRLASLWQKRKNLVLQGPPGVGKTFFAKRLAHFVVGEKPSDRVRMVQFHQSYAYEDFIQGYRPAPNGSGGFVRKDGVFLDFCRAAKADRENTYVFVIDEINRGNLSKIFGELLMLIEPDKRRSDFAIPLTYAAAEEEAFFVPDNVLILGMMNTADRSIALVDYALRRRFAFHKLRPAFDTMAFREHLKAHGAHDGFITNVVSRLKELNTLIEEDSDLGNGFSIGHSFFCLNGNGSADSDWYRTIIDTEIAPLLSEYWFDKPDEEIAGITQRLVAGL